MAGRRSKFVPTEYRTEHSNNSNYIDGKRINEGTINKMMDVMYGSSVTISNGACRWHRICGSHNVQPPIGNQKVSSKVGWLGNGLCMSCWDNGGRPKTKQGKKRYNKAQLEDYSAIDTLLQKTRAKFYEGRQTPS